MEPPRTIGVDEAGRGPVLGPMALAAVALTEEQAAVLADLGVQDSKAFGATDRARARRAELAARVREVAAACACELVPPDVIDGRTRKGQLNALEREVAAGLLRALALRRDDRVLCDGARVFGPLAREIPGLRALDHGEQAHVSVAAASIVAKVARDEAFAAIAARYEGDFGPIRGGGYPNGATRAFLQAHLARHGRLPPETRLSWGTARDLLAGATE